MKNATLISPPQTELKQPTAYIPLNLAYLAAVLEENRIDVNILNLANVKNVEDIEFPDVEYVGITCSSATYNAVKQLTTAIREKMSSKTKIIIGGVHPSVNPIEVYNEIKPDITVTGEAEYLLPAIIKGEVKTERIMNAGIINDLNSIPLPARHLFDRDEVVDVSGIHGQEKGIKATNLITSRGCPYKCSYCCRGHQMFTKYRYRNADNVKTELEHLIDEYEIEHVRFVDDEFTLNKKRILKLCDTIKDLGIAFICITRADTINTELVTAMKKAGCVEIHVGVETGSQRLLNVMHKQIDINELLKGINVIKDVGIRVKTYLMYDYPTETEKDRQLTLDFLRKAKPDLYTLSRFTALPGSELAKQGVKSESDWFYPDEDETWRRYKQEIEGEMLWK